MKNEMTEKNEITTNLLIELISLQTGGDSLEIV